MQRDAGRIARIAAGWVTLVTLVLFVRALIRGGPDLGSSLPSSRVVRR
jgi:hypothetical protein